MEMNAERTVLELLGGKPWITRVSRALQAVLFVLDLRTLSARVVFLFINYNREDAV
jgi:hypothetical protein